MENIFCFRLRCTLSAALVFVASCDRLTGPESRELAGGYHLKRVRGSSDLALIIPHESGGLIIDEIGWSKPLIIARGTGSHYWEVIDTARAEHTRISDKALKSNSTYESIQILAVDKAWASLNPKTRIW